MNIFLVQNLVREDILELCRLIKHGVRRTDRFVDVSGNNLHRGTQRKCCYNIVCWLFAISWLVDLKHVVYIVATNVSSFYALGAALSSHIVGFHPIFVFAAFKYKTVNHFLK